MLIQENRVYSVQQIDSEPRQKDSEDENTKKFRMKDLGFMFSFTFVFVCKRHSDEHFRLCSLYLPSRSIGVSSVIGTFEMKASSFFFTSEIPPLSFNFS